MYEQRSSSLPQVEHYWHMVTSQDGTYPQAISPLWGFVFLIYKNKLSAWLHGPCTKPQLLSYRKGEEYWGVVFKESVLLRNTTKSDLLNRRQILETQAESGVRFAHQLFFVPNYANLDIFVQELITREILIDSGGSLAKPGGSARTRQRVHKKITGLTPKQAEQSIRVQKAIELLEKNLPLADIAQQSGFADQAHMTRELKTLAGLTPKRLRDFFYN